MIDNRSRGLAGVIAKDGLVSMLIGMKPKQRQDYATKNSGDITIVAMAKMVSDMANEMELAKKGAQNTTTPTVLAQTLPAIGNEQPQGTTQEDMDSRLPEEMGIGTLPERSLSNMADGGIIGYADTGLVQPGKTPAERMFQGIRQSIDETNEAAELKNKLSQRYGTASALPGMFKEQSDAERENAKAIMGRLNSMSPTEMRFVLENGALPQGSSSFQPYERNRKGNAPPATPPVVGGGAEDPNGAGAPRSSAAAPPTATPPAAGVPTGAPPPAKATGIQTLVTSPELTLADVVKMRADLTTAQPAAVDSLKEERQKIVDAEKASGLDALQQHKDRVAKQGDPYAKQEERANKQEASVAESAERNPYLALMEAGFAAMAGDSPYAFVNLGKGALAGTKTYREGLALIEKAKEKLTETRDRIDGLRLIRSDLNASEERTILNQNRKTALDGSRFMFEGLAKATGESKAQIEANVKIFMDAKAARRLQEGENARNSATNAAAGARNAASLAMQEKIAGMPGATQQLILALGKGDIEKGYALYNARPKQDDALFLDWSKRSEDPITGEDFRKRYPTAQVYVEAARRNGTGVVDVDTPLRSR